MWPHHQVKFMLDERGDMSVFIAQGHCLALAEDCTWMPYD